MSSETPSTAFTTRFSGFVPKSLSSGPPPPRSKCTLRSRIESRDEGLALIIGFSHAAAQRRNDWSCVRNPHLYSLRTARFAVYLACEMAERIMIGVELHERRKLTAA